MGSARIAALMALAMTITVGCTDETPVFPPPAPTLTLLATGPCDAENIVPVAPGDLIGNADAEDAILQANSVRLTATGIDAGNASGDLSPGTRVTFQVVEPEDEEARLRAGAGVFQSAWNSLDQPAQSGALEFVGRIAQERFLCYQPGTVLVKAVVEDYDPAGGGDVRTLESRTFPIRCMDGATYQRTCAGIMAGVDVGIIVDTDGDVGDGGVGDGGGDGGGDMNVNTPPGEISIQFVPPDDPEELTLGIRGSGLGRSDNVTLNFQVASLGMPLAGRRVVFELPESAPPNVAISPESAITNELGIASVSFIAGGTPGVVRVLAYTSSDGGDELDLFDRSAVIVIRGGVPSYRNMLLTCENPIIPAFTTRLNADEWLFGAAMGNDTQCQVQLGDRLNGTADAETPVIFLTEAGTVTPATSTDADGVARTRHRSGLPVPFDTSPLPYEAESGYNGIFNPRDGLVRIVAVTRGEEDFTDTNGNKIHDDGLDFVTPEQDVDEPYLDVNDNGRYDNDEIAGLVEEFRDTNNDGVWTPRNGVWDGDTEIWADTLVLWVGNVHVDPLNEELAPVRIFCLLRNNCAFTPNFNPNCPPEGPSFYLGPGGFVVVEARFADRNGNCPDGYEQGETFVDPEGALESDNDDFDYASRCFVRVDELGDPIRLPDALSGNDELLVGEGRTELPLAARHRYVIRDTAGPPGPDDRPILSTFAVGVNYTEIGGDQVTEARSFSVCR